MKPNVQKSEKPIWVTIQAPKQRDGTESPPVLQAVYSHVRNGRVHRVSGRPVLDPRAAERGWRLLAVHGLVPPAKPATRADTSVIATDDAEKLKQMLADANTRLAEAEKRAKEAEELLSIADAPPSSNAVDDDDDDLLEDDDE